MGDLFTNILLVSIFTYYVGAFMTWGFYETFRKTQVSKINYNSCVKVVVFFNCFVRDCSVAQLEE